MNIFVLSNDPVEAAMMQCDKHVVKMTTETAQLLSTAVHMVHGSFVPNLYRATHIKHPCTIAVAENSSNFDWLVRHGLALSSEYTYRYGKIHGAAKTIQSIAEYFLGIGSSIRPDSMRPWPLCMPDVYKIGDAVASYRAYYIGEKKRFARWNNGRPPPCWWTTDIYETSEQVTTPP